VSNGSKRAQARPVPAAHARESRQSGGKGFAIQWPAFALEQFLDACLDHVEFGLNQSEFKKRDRF
jgi:hypothetical protein